jgi:ABC-type transport system substrate-binding protein
VAPLGFDSNLSWSHTISGLLDKRPALEFLVGIDRSTGQYIPELAEKWEMAPDGQTWTVTLRKGVPFHEHWGEFTARDVRHAVFLITQPDAAASGTTFWRGVMGVTKTDTVEAVRKKTTQHVEIVDDYTVVFHLQQVVPEFVENLSAIQDLPMESKARWEAGGKDLYGQKVVGTGPLRVCRAQAGLARTV